MRRFEIGDILKLKNGRSPILVMDVKVTSNGTQYIRGMYLSSIKGTKTDPTNSYAWGSWRKAMDFEPHPNYPIYRHARPWESPHVGRKEPPVTENLLYQTTNETGEVLFGTHIATDSKGRMVLEMKGSGNVLAFNDSELEVVTPYTIQLAPLLKDGSSQIHVLGVEGQVEKGDVLLELDSGVMWRVTVLGSKSRSPRPNKSKWMKVPLVPIVFGDK